MSRIVAAGFFAVAIFLLVGCNGDPLKKVKVQGTVTFDGQACPGSGRVTFSPTKVAEGLPLRPASGQFNADGKYEATSFRPGDGLVPGTYHVGVACFDPSKLSGAPSDQEFREASYVSDDYEGQELIVEAGSGTIEFNIDVAARK